MGSFGGQPYFEGPIESKSMIMTPDVPLMDTSAGSRSSSRSSGKKSNNIDVIEGLPGESLALQQEMNAIAGEKRALKIEMFDAVTNSNGKADLTSYNEQLQDITAREYSANSRIAITKQRLGQWKETAGKLKGKSGEYASDANGNYISYRSLGLEKEGNITIRDMSSYVMSSGQVPDDFLNYAHPDVGAFDDKIMSIFKGATATLPISDNDKRDAFASVMRGDSDPSAIAEKYSTGTDGTSNVEALTGALTDINSRIKSNPELRKAYNYKYNEWTRANSSTIDAIKKKNPDLSEKELKDIVYSQFVSEAIGSKRKQVQHFVPKTKKETVGAASFREMLSANHIPDKLRRTEIWDIAKSVGYGAIGDTEMAALNATINGKQTFEDFAKTYDGYDAKAFAETQTLIKEIDAEYNSLEESDDKAQKQQELLRQRASAIRSLSDTRILSDEKAITVIRDSKGIPSSNTLGYSGLVAAGSSYFVLNPVVAGGLIYAGISGLMKPVVYPEMSGQQAALGFQAVTERSNRIESVTIPYAMREQFATLTPNVKVPEGQKIKFAGGEFATIDKIPGLENAQVVSIDTYYYGLATEGGGHTQGVGGVIKIRKEDIAGFLDGNKVTIPGIDGLELVKEEMTIRDYVEDGAAQNVGLLNISEDGDPTVLSNQTMSRDNIAQDDGFVYLTVIFEDDQAAAGVDLLAYNQMHPNATSPDLEQLYNNGDAAFEGVTK